MFINRLLGRPTTCTKVVDHAADGQGVSRQSLKRRDQRIRFLKKKLHIERIERARERASENSTIAGLRELLAERSPTVSISGRDALNLEKEIAMVTALLDEFESDALRTRSAEARIRKLEAEARANEDVIAVLEQDVKAWRCASSSAA